MSQQIHYSNGAFSFPNETSPYEFVSRPIRAIALCIPTVYHVTQKMYVHIREQNYICDLTLTVGSCVVSEFCATKKLHENIHTHKMIFLRFDLVTIKVTVAKKHGV